MPSTRMFRLVRIPVSRWCQSRTFTASPRTEVQAQLKALAKRHANIPPYPHGPAQWYKQSNRGLYGRQSIRFGNNVGATSSKRSRRAWHPNTITKKFHSVILGTNIRIKLTTRVLRTIDKEGGLDSYLLGSKPGRIRDLGMEGWKLRCELLSTHKFKGMARREQERMESPEQNKPQRVANQKRTQSLARQRRPKSQEGQAGPRPSTNQSGPQLLEGEVRPETQEDQAVSQPLTDSAGMHEPVAGQPEPSK